MVSTMETETGRTTAIFSLFNLGCSSCSSVIERKLKKVPGIKGVTVNYLTDIIAVNYDPALHVSKTFERS